MDREWNERTNERKKYLKVHFMSQNSRCLKTKKKNPYERNKYFRSDIIPNTCPARDGCSSGWFYRVAQRVHYKIQKKNMETKTAPITLYVNMFQSIWLLFKFIWLNWIYFICHTIQPFLLFFSFFLYSYSIKSQQWKRYKDEF